MVGSGSSHSKEGNSRLFSVVFKLDFAQNSSIVYSLVRGTLESVDTEDSFNYFKPVSILGISQMRYEYTLIEKEIGSGFLSEYSSDEDASLSLDVGERLGLCSFVRSAGGFELEYESDCDTVNCSPLGGGTPGFSPKFMSFDQVECQDDGKVHMLLRFSNSSSHLFRTFIPDKTLVAEGAWNKKKNQLYVVACRILNAANSLADAFVGDCSIKLNLRFPATMSIKNRSTIVGQIWSNRTVNDSGYFGRIVFQDTGNVQIDLPGLKYEYTETDSISKACAKKKGVKHKGQVYPDGHSLDMRFDMSVRNSKGQVGWGHAFPLFVADKFVGDQLYGKFRPHSPRLGGSEALVSTSHNSVVNISYKLSFTPSTSLMLVGKISSSRSVEISAEGIYDKETGVLCMVGCQHLQSNKPSTKNDSLDCKILVNVQFAPLNAGGRSVKGTIESTRGKSDQLYFQRLELSSSSIYLSQAAESIWRMDLEITLVLISNTFACVFVGLQLFYVKRHPDVLPLISIVMLIVLTLGHMIPLLLNFEALFVANRNRQNVFLGSGGWLEVNEVIVRVVTMIAFLLQFRLLQLTWSSRSNDGSENALWVSEKKVLYLSLPLYAGGALIAWFVHQWKNSYQIPLPRTRLAPVNYNQQHALWGDLKSYAGLILDGFLLPQIMFNLFFNPKEKALASPFYVGTTVVRLLPHAYDLYRAHSSTWKFDLSYIYANPRMDLYSTAWDVIIPCGGMLFAALIYLQQRFGGHCILPKRFRESSVYEKVPVVINEQL